MAEMGRTTAAQAVDKVTASERADVIRGSARFMLDALMDAEVSALVGAEFGERAPERRSSQRNGFRERGWDTGVGRDRARDPQAALRPGDYVPSFLEPRRRAEQVLVGRAGGRSTAFRPGRSTASSSSSGPAGAN